MQTDMNPPFLAFLLLKAKRMAYYRNYRIIKQSIYFCFQYTVMELSGGGQCSQQFGDWQDRSPHLMREAGTCKKQKDQQSQ